MDNDVPKLVKLWAVHNKRDSVICQRMGSESSFVDVSGYSLGIVLQKYESLLQIPNVCIPIVSPT